MVLLKPSDPPGPISHGRGMGSHTTNMAARGQQPWKVKESLGKVEGRVIDSWFRYIPRKVTAIISASPPNNELFRTKDHALCIFMCTKHSTYLTSMQYSLVGVFSSVLLTNQACSALHLGTCCPLYLKRSSPSPQVAGGVSSNTSFEFISPPP